MEACYWKQRIWTGGIKVTELNTGNTCANCELGSFSSHTQDCIDCLKEDKPGNLSLIHI